ncbi:acyl-ACP desaturase [Nocardia pseudovaccinii]|uniref:acyl-ACP desaturase n=1 Tax=Nocardia pseudovaccinii TaxID=189540 RepID=UPI000B2909AF|nr:acyl-ACP desaturase [Nocardia pseudovaccinii]
MQHSYEDVLNENLGTFLRGWGPVSWNSQFEDIEGIDNAPLAQMFSSLAGIEDVSFYMQVKIRHSGVSRLNAIKEFNAIWLAEESEHVRALSAIGEYYGSGQLLRGHSESYLARQRVTSLPLLNLLGRTYPKGMLAAYLTMGSVQEYVALSSYNAASKLVDESFVKDILGQIARQEGRHMRFYRAGAEAVLKDDPRCQRFVRLVMEKNWRAPGVDLLGCERWVQTFSPLLMGTDLIERYTRLDELCGSLPGLSGIELMKPFLMRCETTLQKQSSIPI